ncbi:hypothetical protein Ga0076813_12891, partial [endosymbiont of Ridgeia piscesae]
PISRPGHGSAAKAKQPQAQAQPGKHPTALHGYSSMAASCAIKVSWSV